MMDIVNQSWSPSNFRQLHLPYCLRPNTGDKGYTVLNRFYEPIGLIITMPIQLESRLSIHPLNDRDDTIYLYHDGCVPGRDGRKATREYMSRLELLLNLGWEVKR